MVDVPGMAVPYGTQQLKGQPLFLNILQERPSATHVSEASLVALQRQSTSSDRKVSCIGTA